MEINIGHHPPKERKNAVYNGATETDCMGGLHYDKILGWLCGGSSADSQTFRLFKSCQARAAVQYPVVKALLCKVIEDVNGPVSHFKHLSPFIVSQK